MKSKKWLKTKRMYDAEQGSNILWDGPLNMDNQPRGYGSSSGCKGIQLLAKNMPEYIPGPISKIAKGKEWNGYELMEMGDLKLYIANMVVMMVTMSDIEVILKILLLLVTIGYTAFKWVSIAKKYKKTQ